MGGASSCMCYGPSRTGGRGGLSRRVAPARYAGAERCRHKASDPRGGPDGPGAPNERGHMIERAGPHLSSSSRMRDGLSRTVNWTGRCGVPRTERSVPRSQACAPGTNGQGALMPAAGCWLEAARRRQKSPGCSWPGLGGLACVRYGCLTRILDVLQVSLSLSGLFLARNHSGCQGTARDLELGPAPLAKRRFSVSPTQCPSQQLRVRRPLRRPTWPDSTVSVPLSRLFGPLLVPFPLARGRSAGRPASHGDWVYSGPGLRTQPGSVLNLKTVAFKLTLTLPVTVSLVQSESESQLESNHDHDRDARPSPLAAVPASLGQPRPSEPSRLSLS